MISPIYPLRHLSGYMEVIWTNKVLADLDYVASWPLRNGGDAHG